MHVHCVIWFEIHFGLQLDTAMVSVRYLKQASAASPALKPFVFGLIDFKT